MLRRPPTSTLFPTRRSSDLTSRDRANRTLDVAAAQVVAGVETINVILGIGAIGAVIEPAEGIDRKSTRLNSSHGYISYAVFCLKKKKHKTLREYDESELSVY